jgi:hypothetical protein
MYLYTVYGFSIQSEFVLPELMVASSDAQPDVIVRLGEVALLAPKRSNGTDDFLIETEAGRFLIHADREIVVEPAPEVEEAKTRLFLLGPVLAVLLRLRGVLVLHASAVAVNNDVVAFLGDAGWGKSTLAQAFYVQEHSFVTDDVLAVQMDTSRPTVLPSFPQAKLWPEAAAALGYAPEHLPQLYSQIPKLAHHLTSGFSQALLPLKQVYVLGPVSPEHAIRPLQPQEAFVELVRHSRAMSIPQRPDLDILHFRQCTKLIKQVPISLLRRQRALSALPDLVSLIEEDLARTTC